MEISQETILHIAKLARLEFKGEELQTIKGDLEKIIGFMDNLSSVNTEDIAPLIFMSEEKNVLREDEGCRTISKKEALQNAPKHDSDYFRIPKVLDK
ncbi:MAG: Asp-tRNA(Asn)/Glu-tRNA(Gln) amidotransferase subunit GatC [Bacteroidetes bacterium]|nr:Asp-tRNA(Asn)/Glu-tRNA(Gln) amidotransferase subunit GatC [Bacteroidota bacterium]